MDIYDYLKMDHEEVSALFKQFNKSKSPIRKKEIMGMIAQELFIHAQSEQDTFYKALEHHRLSKEDALHGRKEHREIEEDLRVILEATTLDKQWEKKVSKLQKLVDHHVSEEEGDLFSEAKKVLSKEEAYALKEQMHFLKGKLINSNQLKKWLNKK